MSSEVSTDLQVVGGSVQREMETFAAATGRRLHLEIEPGTYLVANAASLLCSIQDIVTTTTSPYTEVSTSAVASECSPTQCCDDISSGGEVESRDGEGDDTEKGFVFIKLDAGMTDVLRPAL